MIWLSLALGLAAALAWLQFSLERETVSGLLVLKRLLGVGTGLALGFSLVSTLMTLPLLAVFAR